MRPNSVFLSYRRADSAGYAGRLYECLAASLGKGRVFIDVDSIPYGADFVEAIKRTLQNCQVVLVMIGPGWLNARDEGGKLRLAQAEDPVRVEIVTALATKVQVIPILVGGASMPSEKALPEGLKALHRRNAITLSDRRFNLDVQDLIKSLSVPMRRRPWGISLSTLGWGLGIVWVVLACWTAVVWFESNGTSPVSSLPDPPSPDPDPDPDPDPRPRPWLITPW